MMHPTEAELNDYVDGALDAAVHERIQAHVEGCDVCAVRIHDLRSLIRAAAALPGEIAPPAELWAELRALTIDERSTRAAVLRSLRIPLATAALLLVGVASLATWYVTRATTAPRVAVTQPAATFHPSLVALRQAERDHLEVTRALLRLFEQRRAQMHPEVVAAVEHNLRIMNGAIEGAKAALASDPANQDVASILTTTYNSKVRMLRSAVRSSGDI